MSTVVRGLREALVLFVIAAVVIAAAVGIWVAVGGGDFTHRVGVAFMIVGAVIGMTGDLTLSRIGMLPARSTFGLAPEREDGGGGRVLTGVGIFLFVSVPLIVVGALLIT
ncbi:MULTISPECIES: hypothetical protein [Micromonospora]|uniref:Uncharacterized protein n=2 Tax=Micromonospora TaxID=1873 RepID=A0A1C4WD30_9ACTN|nr:MULTISPECIES: hypothetical protein [Micromonospora]NED57323.1 hypothetical protein [Micromonospora aurantiaca]AYF27324.1 hypothetical protein CSH63_07750 [Micromonospora tulbaghiae]MCO1614765.1 hypothetical protein [Micromonospora sp. CPM1]RLQ02811.1 hypothetical protein EAD96_21810 [Micromonospora sp. BL1]SCE94108.1 hypothetical protein GA0070215_104400 [Micromonospora marina]